MYVGCKLPNGLTAEHNGQVIALNGANAGYTSDDQWKNGLAPDSPLRASGVGLTLLEGEKADAFQAWHDISAKGHGPVASGMIFIAKSNADAAKEARSLEGEKTGLDGIDPDKDLPKGLETDKDAGKKG